jgi:hypothetical protein
VEQSISKTLVRFFPFIASTQPKTASQSKLARYFVGREGIRCRDVRFDCHFGDSLFRFLLLIVVRVSAVSSLSAKNNVKARPFGGGL